jgi:hypothetical protein
VVAAVLCSASLAHADDQGVWHAWPGPIVNQGSQVVAARSHQVFFIGGVANPIVWVRSLDDGRGWRQFRTPGSTAPVLLNPALIDDAARNRILAIAPDTSSGVVQVHSLDLASATWSQLPVGGDVPPQGSVWAAIDPALDRVFCASANELFELRIDDTPGWTRWPAGSHPPGVFQGALALDTRRHRLLLQGGYQSGSMVDDFWELPLTRGDTASWAAMPGIVGRYRYDHTAFYDSVRDRYVGNYGQESYRYRAYDTWSAALVPPGDIQPVSQGYNFDGWSSMRPRPVFDPVGDQLLVFATLVHEVMWSLALATPGNWVPRDTVSLPSLYSSGPEPYSRVVVDSRRHRLMMFGNSHMDDPGNDVWVASLDSLPKWHVVNIAGSRPARRSSACAIYDPVRDQLVIHGGVAQFTDPSGVHVTQQVYADTWALSLSDPPAWTQLNGTFTANSQPAAYDPVLDRMMVVGMNPLRVWAFPLAEGVSGHWSEVATSGTGPSTVAYASSAYDPLRERLLVFGGLNDRVWSLDLRTRQWQDIGGIGSAGSCFFCQGDFDLLADRILVFGGRNAPGSIRSLSLSGTSQVATSLSTLGPNPGPSENCWVVMDPGRDALVVSGVLSGGDMWTADWDRLDIRLKRVDRDTAHVAILWHSDALAARPVEIHQRTPYTGWSRLADATFGSDGDLALDVHDFASSDRAGYRLLATDGRPQPVITETWVSRVVPDRGPGPPPPPPPPPPGQPGFSIAVTNPARDAIQFTISVSLEQSGAVELIDLAGRVVRRQSLGTVVPGAHSFTLSPAPVTAGLYWMRVTVGDQSRTSPVTLLR